MSPGRTQLDVVQGRDAGDPSDWRDARPASRRDAISYSVLDLSGSYRKTFNERLERVRHVADSIS